MKIATILGTRPHFIKAAPVSRAIAAHDGVKDVIIHTGQHYSTNMDELFFQQLDIPEPNYRFNVNNVSHAPMVGRIIEHVSEALEKERPDWVIIYGDTNTSLAGALAAKILGIPLAHVEAGLRSFDTAMQEEVNRVLIDRTSDILFCPTGKAVANLNTEGFPLGKSRIIECGDVMYDAALFYKTKSIPPHGLEHLKAGLFYTATVHRAENTDTPNRLKGIFNALEILASEREVILPLHPRTRKILQNSEYDFDKSKITFIEPVGYLEMIWLIDNGAALVTDGGGLQKEAYFLETPCVTLRDNTEWTELIDAGANTLCGANTTTIVEGVNTMARKTIDYSTHFYGNGNASERIISEILA